MVEFEIHNSCTKCGICVKACPAYILFLEIQGKEKKLHVKEKSQCLECRACEFLCPHNSILVKVF